MKRAATPFRLHSVEGHQIVILFQHDEVVAAEICLVSMLQACSFMLTKIHTKGLYFPGGGVPSGHLCIPHSVSDLLPSQSVRI